MKTKILLKARWLLCGLLAVFLTTNVWADDVTSTMDLDTQSGTVSNKTTSFTGTESAVWSLSFDANTSSVSFDSVDKYFQIGSGSKTATSMTWTSSSFSGKKVKEVRVKGSTSGSSATVSVVSGSNSFTATTSTYTSATATTLTFNSPTTGGDVLSDKLVITVAFASATKKNIRLFQIDVIYEGESGGDEPAATLTELKFAGGSDLSKKTYDSSERIDLTGLSVIGTYSDDTNSDVTNDVTWTVSADGITYVSPEALTLTVGMTQIYVKATLGDESVNTLINGLTVTAALPKSTLIFTAACSGSGTADDNVSWTVTSDGTESTFDSSKGIHYGTGSNAVQYIKLTTSDINGTIKKIVVNASAASGVSATASVKVNGVAFGGDAQNISSDATDYTFTGSAIGAIEVTITKESSATKALYVKSIVVTYETTPFVTVDPASLTFAAKQNIAVEAQQFTLTGANLESGLTLLPQRLLLLSMVWLPSVAAVLLPM